MCSRNRVAQCFSTPVLLVLGLLLSAYNTCSCIIGTFLAESRRVTVNSTTVEFSDLSVHFWKPSGQLWFERFRRQTGLFFSHVTSVKWQGNCIQRDSRLSRVFSLGFAQTTRAARLRRAYNTIFMYYRPLTEKSTRAQGNASSVEFGDFSVHFVKPTVRNHCK